MDLIRIIHAIAIRLEADGRKRVIPDRGSDEPYIDRYYLFSKDRYSWLPNIFLHRIHKSDRQDLHDHPWNWGSLVLTGGYWEHTFSGKKFISPGTLRFNSAEKFHRIEIDPECCEVWTLFIIGIRRREWGFMTGEWVQWQKYLDAHKSESMGSDRHE